MDVLGLLLWAAVFWVAPIVVAKKLGERKGRESAWVWGLLIGWLGVIVVALLSDKTEQDISNAPVWAQAGQVVAALKRCPECAEQVQPAARVCRYCRHNFDAETAPATT
jgi:threonine/homoserine efflux transporter RhtA